MRRKKFNFYGERRLCVSQKLFLKLKFHSYLFSNENEMFYGCLVFMMENLKYENDNAKKFILKNEEKEDELNCSMKYTYYKYVCNFYS